MACASSAEGDWAVAGGAILAPISMMAARTVANGDSALLIVVPPFKVCVGRPSIGTTVGPRLNRRFFRQLCRNWENSQTGATTAPDPCANLPIRSVFHSPQP